MKFLSSIIPVALGLTSVAAAQVTVISVEQFDYTAPGLLQNANTGTGWSTAWDLPAGAATRSSSLTRQSTRR